MAWITMSDGGELSLKYPKGEKSFTVEQLAHHIAQLVRFNGAAKRPISIAEHSLLVHEIASQHLGLNVHGQFYALCSWLHKGISGHLVGAAADEVGHGWVAFEHQIEHMVALQLGMVTPKHTHLSDVVVADRMATAMERAQLLPATQPNGLPATPVPGLARVPLLTHIDLMHPARVTLTWQDWRDAFLERFHELDEARRAKNEPEFHVGALG